MRKSCSHQTSSRQNGGTVKQQQEEADEDVNMLDEAEQQQIIEDFQIQHRKQALWFRLSFGVLCGFWAFFYLYHACYHYWEPWGTRILTEYRSQCSKNGYELVKWSVLVAASCLLSSIGLLGNILASFFNSQNDKLMVRDGLLACVHLGVLLNIGSVIWWGTLTAQLFIRERRKEASEIILPLLWTATPIVMALMAWGCEASLRVTKAEIEELKKSTYHFKKL
eukprot:TRINITY_DN6190_c0_g2_i1.p3 TRINITY_DN6190_c0_g2~~TRINITY_DN6190_c0_g2_i1.p3  ORF type:complete len:223 (-),score=19.11 TRINITY_DN6190_c0_g2_i1:538-1206(-)